MNRSADFLQLFGVQARARLSPCGSRSPPRSLQTRIPSLSSVTGVVQALSQQPTLPTVLRLLPEALCRLCASPSHGSTLFARQSPRALSPFCLLDAASEMTSFTPSRGDVALNIGPGSSVVFLRNPSRSYVRTLGRSLVCVRPAGSSPSLSSTGSWGPFHTPRASLRTASPLHAPFEPRRDPTILLWHRPNTFPHESN